MFSWLKIGLKRRAIGKTADRRSAIATMLEALFMLRKLLESDLRYLESLAQFSTPPDPVRQARLNLVNAYLISATQGHDDLVQDLYSKEPDESRLPFVQVFAAERLIADLMPDEIAALRLTVFGEKLRSLGGQALYDAHLQDVRELRANIPGGTTRWELQMLLMRLQRLHMAEMQRQRAKFMLMGSVRRYTFALAVGFLILLPIVIDLAAGAELKQMRFAPPPFLTWLLLAGLCGSFLSIVRRLGEVRNSPEVMTDDPLLSTGQLRLNAFSVTTALMTGPLFALLGYVVICSGLVPEGLLVGLKDTAFAQDPWRWLLTSGAGEALGAKVPNFSSQAMILVAAFSAGWAERLVPDAIDQLLKKAPNSAASGKT